MTKLAAGTLLISGIVTTAFGVGYTNIEDGDGTLDVDMNATAKIIALEISVSNPQDLDFGDILTTSGGGTVQIDPTAVVKTPAAATQVAEIAAAKTAAVVSITGVTAGTNKACPAVFYVGSQANAADVDGKTFEVTLPGTITLTNTDPAGGTMDITALRTNDLSNEFTVGTALLDLSEEDAAGTAVTAIQVAVGGTLTVGASQAPGTYLGTEPVTFAWK